MHKTGIFGLQKDEQPTKAFIGEGHILCGIYKAWFFAGFKATLEVSKTHKKRILDTQSNHL
jgi:hypothetical protein